MSERQTVELDLLREYLEAARDAEESNMNYRLRLYEKQLALCKSQGYDFNVSYHEAMIPYIKATHKIKNGGIIENALKGGDFTVIIANEYKRNRMREAIPYLDEAITLDEGYAGFWIARAHLYKMLGDKEAALRDLNHVLAQPIDDMELYLTARRMQDTVEAMNTSDKCFIATAVYENPDSFELLVLRGYRDRVLLSSSIGKAMVSCYYAVSPSIARVLGRSHGARRAVRIFLLDPFVELINRRQDSG